MEWPQGSDYGGPRPALRSQGTWYLGADRLLTDVSTIIRERFWEERYGAVAEEFAPEAGLLLLSRPELQRASDRIVDGGVRSNWGSNVSPHGAEPIANLIIGGHAAANRWRVPEHSTNKWLEDRTAGSPVLRHYGATSAHSLERSHLLLQSWELGGRKLDWLPNLRRRFSPTGHFSEKLTSTALCRLVSFPTLPPTGSVTRGLLERIKHTQDV